MAFRVKGDSMKPDYHDGYIVYIHKQPAINVGEIGASCKKTIGWEIDPGTGITAIEIKAGNPNKLEHIAFTRAEIDILWKHTDDKLLEMMLILIYGGYRISEFCGIEKDQVDIENQSDNILDSKTSNGIRVVHIADKILQYYKNFMQEDSKYLVSNTKGNQINYKNFYRRY